MDTIQLSENIIEQLKQEITKGIKAQLDEFLKNFSTSQHNDILTRAQVAEKFDVDLSTIHNWCKSGKLKPYGLGSRVYFRKVDLDESLTPIH